MNSSMSVLFVLELGVDADSISASKLEFGIGVPRKLSSPCSLRAIITKVLVILESTLNARFLLHYGMVN